MREIVQYWRLLLQAFAGIAVVSIFYPVFYYEMIRRFIYRAVVTTNKSWSTFFDIRSILRRVLILQTLLPTPSVTLIGITWCGWHHCDIGITQGACASPNGTSSGAGAFFRPTLVFYVAPDPTSSLKTTVMPTGCGQGTFMCFIFYFKCCSFLDPLPAHLFFFFFFAKSHPQVLHIWWVKNDLDFAQEPPRLCLLIYFLFFFVYFCTFFAVSRDFDREIGDLTNEQKTHRYLTIF